MNGVLGALLPLAIAVAISPIAIIAEILLLLSDKPAKNGGACLAGFVVGVGVVLGILVLVATAIDLSKSGPSKGAGHRPAGGRHPPPGSGRPSLPQPAPRR